MSVNLVLGVGSIGVSGTSQEMTEAKEIRDISGYNRDREAISRLAQGIKSRKWPGLLSGGINLKGSRIHGYGFARHNLLCQQDEVLHDFTHVFFYGRMVKILRDSSLMRSLLVH
jgi:hypothetical protein